MNLNKSQTALVTRIFRYGAPTITNIRQNEHDAKALDKLVESNIVELYGTVALLTEIGAAVFREEILPSLLSDDLLECAYAENERKQARTQIIERVRKELLSEIEQTNKMYGQDYLNARLSYVQARSDEVFLQVKIDFNREIMDISYFLKIVYENNRLHIRQPSVDTHINGAFAISKALVLGSRLGDAVEFVAEKANKDLSEIE